MTSDHEIEYESGYENLDDLPPSTTVYRSHRGFIYDNPREAARANARAKSRRYLEESLELQEAVYRTVGSAALCWTDGEYDENRAKALARELVKWIDKHYQPRLEESS